VVGRSAVRKLADREGMPAACEDWVDTDVGEGAGSASGAASLESWSITSSSHRLSDMPSVARMITSCSWVWRVTD
jgi:hypothetical protein